MTPAASAMPLSLSHLPAGSPWWLFALVIAGLALHIGGGTIGIVSGYGAVSARKGALWHRRFGKTFVFAMLLMAAMGTILSVPIHQRGNIAGGVLSAYLVATAWMAVKRRPGSVGAFETGAMIVALAMSAAMLFWGYLAATSPTHTLDGYAPPLYFVFGGGAALFATLDLRVILRGGLSAGQRIRRHLWRMCFAFFFASASFFLGQQKVMPKAIHGSPVLWLLGLAPLGFMIYWLIRTRMRRPPVAVAAE
jgi:F0F1-type ATP synthase membrane subunit c/vacuolar-type H+-ATPase subunit K